MPDLSPAFSALRVVELADEVAGEYAGKLLADLGADVVKVEPPAGVGSRHTGPFATEPPATTGPTVDASLAYWAYNTSKRSVVLSDSPTDRAARDQLIARADVLLSTAPPSALNRQELDFDALRRARPELIVVSVTPFGLTGPYAEYRTSDLVALAGGGLLNSCGYDDHSIPPIRPGGNQAYMTAAIFAHCGLLLALAERQRTGLGQLVDVSVHEAIAVSCELANPYWFYPRALVQRQTARHAQPLPTEPAIFPCADGVYVYFALVLSDDKAWAALVEWMDDLGLAADLTDAKYLELDVRQREFAHVRELIDRFFLGQGSQAAYHEGQRRGLPLGPLVAVEDLLDDVHLVDRDFFVALARPDGNGETALFPGAPYRFSQFSTQLIAPPRLGEHTDVVFQGSN